jgi:anti-anti-sigma regulatory factor
MEIVTERTPDGIILKVSGRVTIADAGELRQLMMDEVVPGMSATIDLAGVAECDLSLFQLLCAAHKRSLGTSGSITLHRYSDEVHKAMASAGIMRTSGCTDNTNENCLWHEARKG